jgi:hypothetical protein
MRETRSSGSVEGVMRNRDPYSDYFDCLTISSSITTLDVKHLWRALAGRANLLAKGAIVLERDVHLVGRSPILLEREIRNETSASENRLGSVPDRRAILK